MLFASFAIGQEAQDETAPVSKLPDLAIPQKATVAEIDAIINTAKAIRPESSEQYEAMQKAIRDASQQLMRLIKDKENARYRQAELDNISASILLMSEDNQEKTLEQVHKFLRSKDTLSIPDVQTGMMAAAVLELQPDKNPARDTYALMDDLLKDDEREEMQALRVNLNANIRRLELLGSKFELVADTIDGQKLDIEDLKGKYVIVDFFATWCGPCLEEVPRLKTQYEKYQSKGLEVVGISLDESKASLQTYLDKSLLTWPIIHDAESDPMKRMQVRYGISQLPTVLLLNKEGVVVSLEARGAELERLMQMLFEKPTLAPEQAESSDETKDTRAVPSDAEATSK